MSPEGASDATVVRTFMIHIFYLSILKQYASIGKQLGGLARRFF